MPEIYSNDRLKLTPNEVAFIYNMADKNIAHIAKLLEISDSALYKKVHGRVSLSLREFEVLCVGLGISPRQLIKGDYNAVSRIFKE